MINLGSTDDTSFQLKFKMSLKSNWRLPKNNSTNCKIILQYDGFIFSWMINSRFLREWVLKPEFDLICYIRLHNYVKHTYVCKYTHYVIFFFLLEIRRRIRFVPVVQFDTVHKISWKLQPETTFCKKIL